MLIKKVLIVFCILVIFFCEGCQDKGKSIIVAGSTSIQPFAEKLAEAYMAKYPGVLIDVQGGGSSAGIQAARTGAAHVGTSSRNLKEEEKDLNTIIIARDGIAIIVNSKNPVDDLSLGQIHLMFTGEIRTWKAVGGLDKPITLVTREEGSGTRGAFQKLVMGKDRIDSGALVQDSNGAVRETVAHDPHAIGYISMGLVNEKVKALKIGGIFPTEENILKKKYTLARPFLFVTKETPQGEIADFITFVLSPEGQELIKEEGLIAVR